MATPRRTALLKTGKVNWCVTPNASDGNRDPSIDVFSSLLFWGTKLWIGMTDQVLAEIHYDDPEIAKLVARCMRTGKVLWEYMHPRAQLEPWLGDTHFFEVEQMAVASVAMKKSHWVPSQLLIFNTETKSIDFVLSCWNILAPGSRGVVLRIESNPRSYWPLYLSLHSSGTACGSFGAW
jgi:hypothetical protein